MAAFYYTGKAQSGKTVSGFMNADSKSEVLGTLRRQQIYPISVTKNETSSREITFKRGKKRVSQKDLSVFCRQFNTIVAAGISVIECIDILRKQTENKTLSDALDSIYEDVQTGVTLSNAMKSFPKVFTELLINMVEAGEISGQLDIIMKRMADHFEKEYKINAKIKGAMIYPIILLSVASIVSAVLILVVLPGFVNMFEGFGIDLPAPTRILLAVGNFMRRFWWLIIGGFILLFYTMKKSLNTAEGRLKYDDLKLKLPIVGKLNKKVATTRFARSLSTMLNSGISIIEAMEMVGKVVGNRSVNKMIDSSMERIKKGEGISGPLDSTGLFPPMLISMIEIGEETGSLNALLETTANFYDDEVDYAIESMIQLINPIILLGMAVVVGTIVMAVAMPMFDMYNHL